MNKRLKIPKRYSEAEYRRQTDNTMTSIKRTNNDKQNITQKTKDRATRTPLKIGGKLRCTRRLCSTCGSRRVTIASNPVRSMNEKK
jgi:hypothetical protein